MFQILLNFLFSDRVTAALKQDFAEGNFSEKLSSFATVVVMFVAFFSAIVNLISAILK